MGNLSLYRGPHLEIEKLQGDAIVIARRTATEPGVAELRALAAEVEVALAGVHRRRHAILVDLRPARLRPGRELDAALATFREALVHDFVAIARLVATSVGALQSQRLSRDERRVVRSFADEDAGLAWLRERVAEARKAQG